jgi:ABC-2 type transport system permease protein
VAVYKRAYRPYEGPLTPERTRFLVLPRYAFQELFSSRVLTVFVALCFAPFLLETAWIYVANSEDVRLLLGIAAPGGDRDPFRIGPSFFVATLGFQGGLAFLLTAWVAPVLVSPDLTNGALPLYLSRPFSRAEYVLGKATALFGLLSCITWVPGLALFGLQAGLAGTGWLSDHHRVAGAIFAGASIWALVLTLLGLALSAFIRWRLVASAALFAIFFLGTAFGEGWRGVLRNPWGRLTNLSYLIGLVWKDLFGATMTKPLAREMLDDRRGADLPTWAAWTALLAVCAFSLWLLNRRLQAREVVS